METLAAPPLPAHTREEPLLSWAHAEDDHGEGAPRLRLAPLTARLVAIALLNPRSGRGRVWYEHPGGVPGVTAQGRVELLPGTEAALIGEFWRAIVPFRRIVTFNGRFFTSPYLMVRSALLGIPPARNLLPYRFNPGEHCDLLDQLTFYGATRRFSLEAYCRGFGIPPPGGEAGRPEVSSLVEEGRYRDVAELAADTARAIAELYRVWTRLLESPGGVPPS
ncbi:MAG TPA: hypothetical protein VL221_02475 [Bacteroidota bacterium]|nr:hypothetical protein [Bacteroidota bacterium]